MVILDIGSGNVKAYKVNNLGDVESIYIKNIMFKQHYSKESGISEKDIQELILAIKDVQNISNEEKISAYATSIFRMLNKEQFKKLNDKIMNETNIKINLLNQEKEELYMAKSVGTIKELDGPYLVCCVGGSSTEMIVMENGEILEQLTEEFATGDVIKEFPQLMEDRTDVKMEDIKKFIERNFKKLPKTKCKYAIFTGFHLMYHTVAGNKMHNNKFFNKAGIPYYLTVNEYRKYIEELLYERDLQELRDKYPANPKFMNQTRGGNSVVVYLLEKVGAEYYFPTNFNMINGIVAELMEESNK